MNTVKPVSLRRLCYFRSLLSMGRTFSKQALGTEPCRRSFFTPARKNVNFAWNSLRVPKRGLFIQVEKTPNPDSLKFLPGLVVMESGTMDFPNPRAARVSPLASKLFQIEGVTGVFFGSNFVSVNKAASEEWNVLKPQIFATITEFHVSQEPILYEGEVPHNDTEIFPEDSEVVAMIKELIETRFRPAVQQDGGDITFKGFEDGIVMLQMQGSCSGCPSSSVTLKNGIERSLMHWIPEVKGVMQVTDDDLEKINLEAFKKLDAEQKAKKAAKAKLEVK